MQRFGGGFGGLVKKSLGRWLVFVCFFSRWLKKEPFSNSSDHSDGPDFKTTVYCW